MAIVTISGVISTWFVICSGVCVIGGAIPSRLRYWRQDPLQRLIGLCKIVSEDCWYPWCHISRSRCLSRIRYCNLNMWNCKKSLAWYYQFSWIANQRLYREWCFRVYIAPKCVWLNEIAANKSNLLYQLLFKIKTICRRMYVLRPTLASTRLATVVSLRDLVKSQVMVIARTASLSLDSTHVAFRQPFNR